MKAVQDVKAQHIMILIQSGVIHVVNASHHVHQTVSALLSANVCYIFEHLNICINVCFVCSGLTLCGLIGSTLYLRKQRHPFIFVITYSDVNQFCQFLAETYTSEFEKVKQMHLILLMQFSFFFKFSEIFIIFGKYY